MSKSLNERNRNQGAPSQDLSHFGPQGDLFTQMVLSCRRESKSL